MNIRHLFFLLILPLCCFGERDYKMIAQNNGLTAELLAVGPTSLTFSVVRSPDIEKDEVTWVSLIGKLDIEKKGWYQLTNLDFEQPHGKTIFEVPYSQLIWHNVDEYKSAFEKKAWFSLLLPFDCKDNTEREFQGMYSEGNEENDEAALEVDEFRAKVLAREAEENREERERFEAAEAKKNELVSRLVYEHNERLFKELARLAEAGATEAEKETVVSRLVAESDQIIADALARLAAEEAGGEAKASPPSRLWLYVGILFALSVLFYLVRRKLKTGN